PTPAILAPLSIPTRRSSDLKEARLHALALQDIQDCRRPRSVRTVVECKHDRLWLMTVSANNESRWIGIVGFSRDESTSAVSVNLDRKSTRLNSSHQIISYAV